MPSGTQLYAIIGVVLVVALAAAVVIAIIISGRTDTQIIQLAVSVLGFAGTIITVLLGLAQLNAKVTQVATNVIATTAKVEEVHTAVNSKMQALIDTTASNSFQKGQAAGPNA
jgi:hypothetical protein